MGRRPRIVIRAAAVLLWSAAVLLLFVAGTASLTAGVLDRLSTAALGAVSAYALLFAGFRLGRRLGSAFPRGADPLERTLLELALGAGIVIAAMFLGGALGLYGRGFAVGVLGLALIGPQRAFLSDLRSRWAALAGRGSPPQGGPGGVSPTRFLAGVLAAAGALTLVESLAPPAAQDALVYHLAVPARYIREGGFVPIEGNFFASFPQNIEMLFTLGLLLDGGALAQWFHWLLGAASVASVAALARALPGRGSGILAAAVFATIPTVMLIAGWAYIDLGVVFFATLCLVSFLRWLEREETAWLVMAAVLAGLAAGSKYTAGFQGILLVAGIAALGVLRKKPAGWTLRRAAGAAAAIGLLASPWWVKNIAYTGNPLFPFCYGILGGDGWDRERAAVLSMALGEWGGSQGVLETLLLPWRLTMSGEFFSQENFDGVIGCVFLIGAPSLALAFRRSVPHGILLAFIALQAAFWIVTTRQVRFLLPALAAASALLGGLVEEASPERDADPWPGRIRRATVGVVGAALVYNILFAGLHFAYHNPLPVVLGLETEAAYLRRELPGGDHVVFEHIAERLPEESHILFGSLGNPGFLCKRRYHADALFENRTLAAILARSSGPDAAAAALRAEGFTHLLFRMENVFDATGKRSEIPLADQEKLMHLLNRHGRLLIQAKGTCLYELGQGIGPAALRS